MWSLKNVNILGNISGCGVAVGAVAGEAAEVVPGCERAGARRNRAGQGH